MPSPTPQSLTTISQSVNRLLPLAPGRDMAFARTTQKEIIARARVTNNAEEVDVIYFVTGAATRAHILATRGKVTDGLRVDSDPFGAGTTLFPDSSAGDLKEMAKIVRDAKQVGTTSPRSILQSLGPVMMEALGAMFPGVSGITIAGEHLKLPKGDVHRLRALLRKTALSSGEVEEGLNLCEQLTFEGNLARFVKGATLVPDLPKSRLKEIARKLIFAKDYSTAETVADWIVSRDRDVLAIDLKLEIALAKNRFANALSLCEEMYCISPVSGVLACMSVLVQMNLSGVTLAGILSCPEFQRPGPKLAQCLSSVAALQQQTAKVLGSKESIHDTIRAKFGQHADSDGLDALFLALGRSDAPKAREEIKRLASSALSKSPSDTRATFALILDAMEHDELTAEAAFPLLEALIAQPDCDPVVSVSAVYMLAKDPHRDQRTSPILNFLSRLHPTTSAQAFALLQRPHYRSPSVHAAFDEFMARDWA